MQLKITKIDSKGYGLAKDVKGNRYRVLGALPDEVVTVKVISKNKKNILAEVDKVIKSSKFRVEPKDLDSYLNLSPWQILDFDKENILKAGIVKEEFNKFLPKLNYYSRPYGFDPAFAKASADRRAFSPERSRRVTTSARPERVEGFEQFQKRPNKQVQNFVVASSSELDSWNYRNKAEFQFCSLPDGKISFAVYKHGAKGQIESFHQSSIFAKSINCAASKILNFLNAQKVSIDLLRYLIIRSHKNGTVALLCMKKIDESIKSMVSDLLDLNIKGLILATPKADFYETIYKFGECELQEQVLDKNFYFNFDHFFQINVPMFEKVILDIKDFLSKLSLKKNLILVELFAGVGVIGQLLSDYFQKVIGVEVSKDAKKYALKNAKVNRISNFEFIESDVNDALKIIEEADILVVDPPRVGLSKEALQEIEKHLPGYVIYLSCSHETLARDLSELSDNYEIKFLKGYNFFPHTAHIECLAILQRRW